MLHESEIGVVFLPFDVVLFSPTSRVLSRTYSRFFQILNAASSSFSRAWDRRAASRRLFPLWPRPETTPCSLFRRRRTFVDSSWASSFDGEALRKVVGSSFLRSSRRAELPAGFHGEVRSTCRFVAGLSLLRRAPFSVETSALTGRTSELFGSSGRCSSIACSRGVRRGDRCSLSHRGSPVSFLDSYSTCQRKCFPPPPPPPTPPPQVAWTDASLRSASFPSREARIPELFSRFSPMRVATSFSKETELPPFLSSMKRVRPLQ